jgi:hypothetical protein
MSSPHGTSPTSISTQKIDKLAVCLKVMTANYKNCMMFLIALILNNAAKSWLLNYLVCINPPLQYGVSPQLQLCALLRNRPT